MDCKQLYTGEQLKLLEEFRKKLSDLTPEEKKWADNACLFRYLRAREWKIPKSEKMIRDTVAWRREYKPETIKWTDVAKTSEKGAVFVQGADKEGHPIIIMRPRNEVFQSNAAYRTAKIKQIVYMLETLTVAMPPGVEKLTILFDMKGFKSSNASDMKTTKEFLSILANHYPERLCRAMVVDPPWYFWMLWKTIYPFIDPVSRQKVVFKKSNAPYDPLFKVAPRDQLEASFDGTSPFAYDVKSYGLWCQEMDLLRDRRLKYLMGEVDSPY